MLLEEIDIVLGLIPKYATVRRFLIKLNRAVQYRVIQPIATRQEPSLPSDMNFKHLSAKTPQEIEAEYDLLNVYSESNYTTDAAVMPQNKSKNRYINTLPCKIRKLRYLIISRTLTQHVGLVILYIIQMTTTE